MNEFTDTFKAMTLREFFLESRLAKEFQAARFLSWAGDKLAWPLSKVVAAKFGIPAKPVELAVRAITGERFTALPSALPPTSWRGSSRPTTTTAHAVAVPSAMR